MPDVNPFEPWRPRSSPGDEGRRPPDQAPPWRRPRDPEEEPEPAWHRQPRAAEPAWTPRDEPARRGSGGTLVWLTIGLIVLSLALGAVNGRTHVSRVAASAAALWVGLLLAIVVGSEWRWYGRLAWAVSGLAGMVLCWMFVPTTDGNS